MLCIFKCMSPSSTILIWKASWGNHRPSVWRLSRMNPILMVLWKDSRWCLTDLFAICLCSNMLDKHSVCVEQRQGLDNCYIYTGTCIFQKSEECSYWDFWENLNFSCWGSPSFRIFLVEGKLWLTQTLTWLWETFTLSWTLILVADLLKWLQINIHWAMGEWLKPFAPPVTTKYLRNNCNAEQGQIGIPCTNCKMFLLI